jgi:hypothetical protein
MKTAKRRWRAMHWGAGILALFTLVALWLAVDGLVPSRADAPVSDAPARPVRVRRGFIGLPDVNTISVQNSLPTAASITVTFALSNGTPISTVIDTLPAESIRLYAEPTGFSGQGRVETKADVPESLASSPIFGVNFELSESGNDAYRGSNWAQSGLLSASALRQAYYLPLPLVMKNYMGWTAMFTVQNTGLQTATFAVDFRDQSGVPVHQVVDILGINGSVSFDLADIAALPDPYIGNVWIASDQALEVAAGVRLYHTGLGLRSAYQQVSLYEASTALLAPALFKRSDLQTSELCVQNLGTATADVRVAYTDGVTRREPVASFGSYCFDQGTEAHADGWTGGALITSSEPIAAVALVTALQGATPVGRWSYSVPTQPQPASGGLALPLLFNDFQSWTSTIHLYNFGEAQAVVTPRYVSYPGGFVYCASAITIPANSMRAIPQSELPPFVDVAMGYLRSTQPLAAVASVTSDKSIGDTDRHFGYEASYLDAQVDPGNPCDRVHEAFLPAILK